MPDTTATVRTDTLTYSIGTAVMVALVIFRSGTTEWVRTYVMAVLVVVWGCLATTPVFFQAAELHRGAVAEVVPYRPRLLQSAVTAVMVVCGSATCQPIRDQVMSVQDRV